MGARVRKPTANTEREVSTCTPLPLMLPRYGARFTLRDMPDWHVLDENGAPAEGKRSRGLETSINADKIEIAVIDTPSYSFAKAERNNCLPFARLVLELSGFSFRFRKYHRKMMSI